MTSQIPAALKPGSWSLCAYLTAGFPSADSFGDVLNSVARVADLIEIGVPFSDPIADGVTIQSSSAKALAAGITLDWILELLSSQVPSVPVLLMGYYNPFLAYGIERLGSDLVTARVSGLIVPDLPLEESADLNLYLLTAGIDLIQLVAPTTPGERLRRLAAASRGAIYAVTRNGVTGGQARIEPETVSYLERVRQASSLPVMVGFGIRTKDQIRALTPHADAIVVGSALVEVLDRGQDPAEFLRKLREP